MNKNLPRRGKTDTFLTVYQFKICKPMNQPRVPHTLLPLFGTRCRSQGYAYVHPNAGTDQYVHFVAFRDAANADSWTVQRVTHTGHTQTRESWVRVDSLGQHMGFEDALAMIEQYDSYHRGNTQGFKPLFPDAAALGFEHFRAFAEREGYVFDRKGKAHPRPAHGVLPSNAEFSAEAIASADKNCQRPASEFDTSAPSRRLPDTLFLFDAFNRKAIGKKHSSELASLRVLNLMDTFVRHIETFSNQLHAYRADYLKPGGGARLSAAELSLVQARNQLRQMQAYGVDTTAFEKLTQECAIIACVAHAQGTYDQLRRQLGKFDELETLFKTRASEALRLYEQLEKGDIVKDKTAATKYAEGYTALQEMMIQGGAPAVPGAIMQFADRYRAERARLIPPVPDTAKPPKPPAP